MSSKSTSQLRRKTAGAPSAKLAPLGDAKADVRKCLLQAALELLQRQGFSALTQARVAELAGVRQSHLTYYFPTRNDLLKAVIEETTSTLLGVMSNQGRPTLTKIKSAMVEMARQQFVPRLILSIIMAVEEDSSLMMWMQSFKQEFINRLAATLRQIGLQIANSDLHLYLSALVGALVMGLSGTDTDTAATTVKTVRMAFEKLVSASSTAIPVRRKVARNRINAS
jgi:AcrR family transcriptional regulator